MINEGICNETKVNVLVSREVEVGEKFRVTLEFLNATEKIENVKILFNRLGEKPSIIIQMIKEKEENNKVKFCAKVQLEKLGNYFFFFIVKIGGKELAIKLSRRIQKPTILNLEEESPYWKVLVIPKKYDIPEWSTDKIAYQIFVDRFFKGPNPNYGKQEGRNYRSWEEMPDWKRNEKGEFHNNDFFGGNLKGIEEKLDYLKSLAVGIIYISPINESLYRYERYAATDHKKIDSDAGTFEDLKTLHEKANAKGMHIILDIAFNHCNSDNPIFQEALRNPKSNYRNWFYFDEKGNYRYWYGIFKDMPIFNQNNPEYQDYVYGENGVISKYAPYVDGFRLDLAEELQPFFLEGIRNRANIERKRLILGEFWEKVPLTTLGKGIDCPTNYLFTNAILKFVANGENEYLKWQIQDILDSYPQNTIDTMFNSLDTHDIMRVITILSKKCIRGGYDRIWEIDKEPSPWHIDTWKGRDFLTDSFRKFEFENDTLSKDEYEKAKQRLKVTLILQYFLPGIPCIYYGTEVGLHGFKDPFNRKCFPWGKEDSELLEFYRNIGKFRSNYKGKGSTFKVNYSDEEIFAFERRNETNSIFVVVNRGKRKREIEIPEYFMEEEKTKMFMLNADIDKRYLLPYGGIVILK